MYNVHLSAELRANPHTHITLGICAPSALLAMDVRLPFVPFVGLSIVLVPSTDDSDEIVGVVESVEWSIPASRFWCSIKLDPTADDPESIAELVRVVECYEQSGLTVELRADPAEWLQPARV